MALALIGTPAAVASSNTEATSHTFTGITAPSGSERILILLVSARTTTGDVTVSGITVGGTAMTNKVERSPSGYWQTGAVFSLVNPPSSGDIIVTLSRSGTCVIAHRYFSGAHQTTQDGSTGAGNVNDSSLSVNVASATDQIVVDGIGGWGLTTYTAGGGQTDVVTAATSVARGSSSEKPGTSTTAMSWTGGSNGQMVLVAFAIKPSSGDVPLPRVPVLISQAVNRASRW